MDYIPGDAIPLSPLADIIFFVSLSALVLIILAMMAVTLIDRRERRRLPAERRFHRISKLALGKWPFWAMVPAMLGIIVSLALGFASLSLWHDAIGDEIEDAYGIRLDGDQLDELNYPLRALDGDEPRALGSTYTLTADGEGGYERREIVLIWDRGSVLLADGQGQPLAPLKAR